MKVVNVYAIRSNFNPNKKWYSTKLSDGTSCIVKFEGVKVPDEFKKKSVFGICNGKVDLDRDKEPYVKEDGTVIPQATLTVFKCEFVEPVFEENEDAYEDCTDLDDIF